MSGELVLTIQSKTLAAIEAEEEGDTARALQLMRQVQMALAATPDGKNEDSEASFDRTAVDATIARLQRLVNSRCGVVTMPVRYERG